MAANLLIADQQFIDSVECLGRTHKIVDRLTVRHEILVGELTAITAPYLGVSDDMAKTMGIAARLHDIGKIAIPQTILHKQGPLTEDERQQVHAHASYGAEILSISDNPLYQFAAEIAQHHHEHMDGTGYPHGLQGNEIPLAARIVAVCDTYEALRSPRSYKSALSHEQALEILTCGDDRVSPNSFDEKVLKAFCDIEDVLEAAYNAHVAAEA